MDAITVLTMTTPAILLCQEGRRKKKSQGKWKKGAREDCPCNLVTMGEALHNWGGRNCRYNILDEGFFFPCSSLFDPVRCSISLRFCPD